MNRILWRSICIIMMVVGLLGCQQGVTDVGNPTISEKPPQDSPSAIATNSGPTLGQLIGAYSQPQVVSASPPASGSPSTGDPAVAIALPSCKTDPQKIQSITPTSDPTQIVLSDFLDYGDATDNILAAYNSKTGAIAFEVSDPAVAIASCIGSAKSDSTGIAITLQCKARVSGESDCQVTFDKK